MAQTKIPAVAFAFRSPLAWEFIEKMWNHPMYYGYDIWSVLENELYDFMY